MQEVRQRELAQPSRNDVIEELVQNGSIDELEVLGGRPFN